MYYPGDRPKKTLGDSISRAGYEWFDAISPV